jgi:putative glutathione S-transferase
VYHGHFTVNLRRIVDLPRLWAYTRRLRALPAFGGTTYLDQIKRHYYGTQRHLNPRGIVPAGPVLDRTP